MNILKKYRYDVKNLDCANCAKKIEDKIASTQGYNNVVLNYSTLKLTFETEEKEPLKQIKKIVSKIEPETEILEEQTANQDRQGRYKKAK